MTRLAKGLSVSGLILFGTTTSLFAKIVYEIESTGEDGQQKYFHKPWAMTSVMFIGMSFCLPVAFYLEKKKNKARRAEEEPLLDPLGAPKPARSQVKETLMLAIPTFFDLLATILMNIGLLWVTASVYQMMRGAEMLFAALFAVTFLGRRLNKYHLGGIACCVAGVCMVGTSSYLSGEGSSTQVVTPEQNLAGMALIIVSQAVQAAQLTFEDFFMADLNMEPMKIVGFEGLFGVIGTLGIMAPIAYYLPGKEGEGIHENIVDTVTMIGNSRALQIVLAVDMFALLMYNVSGMLVTGHLGAVFRTVLETTRTLFVWLVDLLLFYTPLGLGKLGESWSVYSYLQAAGFVVLVTGTLVYGRGDEEGMRREMAEALAVQAAEDPSLATAEPTLTHAPAGTIAYTIPGAPALGVPTPSMPMDMGPSSFKATQTIMTGSYSRSLGRGAGSYMRGSHMARHQVDDE